MDVDMPAGEAIVVHVACRLIIDDTAEELDKLECSREDLPASCHDWCAEV